MCPTQDHAAKRQLLLVITPPVPATLRTMRAPLASTKAPQRSKVAMNAPAASIHHLTAAVVVLVWRAAEAATVATIIIMAIITVKELTATMVAPVFGVIMAGLSVETQYTRAHM